MGQATYQTLISCAMFRFSYSIFLFFLLSSFQDALYKVKEGFVHKCICKYYTVNKIKKMKKKEGKVENWLV